LNGFWKAFLPEMSPVPPPLVDDSGGNSVVQIVITGGSSRVNQPDPSHVAVGHLIPYQVNRMVGAELGVHGLCLLAEV
jgi:hypothetical protein